ncbi:DNA alkylation repair protein [Phenylobacterium sp. J426]|uniref:DNA alkylation repair protein n=1 Tax=Phenylobacterium sp. J426 TaxID=2898439 RepID=UPI00215087D3|nr:DNA alkylation repair protein [Phenylobacterium sp. J426]MCR5875600.1 DNA alkylation repair protein [Phenylobacterium sp. J426]
MDAEHLRLIGAIEAAADPSRRPPSGYFGQGDHPLYGLSVPAKREIARRWVRTHDEVSPERVLALVDSLMGGASYEEKTLGPLILGCHAKARADVTPSHVDRWLGGLQGWAEVDHLCQGLFSADQLLATWVAWEPALAAWSRDGAISRRRASLVLLTGPTRASPDPRLKARAFANIDTLAAERDPLITKAVSWLLRSMTRHHAADVEAYVAANAERLPAVAVREVRTKLATGAKSGRPAPTT